ncbi:hypothetical protein PINS_up022862 [Pythium insidiosum]|nr:hypothetical protein PINS_up022862 [Pythium insidiosum]
MLDRVDPDLAILSLAFLKKLSIFEENKDAMVELATVEKLVRYVKCDHDKVIQVRMQSLLEIIFVGIVPTRHVRVDGAQAHLQPLLRPCAP